MTDLKEMAKWFFYKGIDPNLEDDIKDKLWDLAWKVWNDREASISCKCKICGNDIPSWNITKYKDCCSQECKDKESTSRTIQPPEMTQKEKDKIFNDFIKEREESTCEKKG